MWFFRLTMLTRKHFFYFHFLLNHISSGFVYKLSGKLRYLLTRSNVNRMNKKRLDFRATTFSTRQTSNGKDEKRMQGKRASQSQQQLFNYTFLWANEMSERRFVCSCTSFVSCGRQMKSCHCHSFWFVKLGVETETEDIWYKVWTNGERCEFLMKAILF